MPDSQHPVVFRMRKKGEEAFLLKTGGGFVFNKKDQDMEQGLDVILGQNLQGEIFKILRFNGDPVTPDLKAKASWDPKALTWTIVLSAGTPGGGLQVSDRLLYEAPTGGYQESFTFQIRVPRDSWKLPLIIIPGKPDKEIQLTQDTPAPPAQILHIYLRSRQPTIYSRLFFEHPLAKADLLEIGASIITNPYGDRNLEAATDLPGEIQISLDNEVRESYRLGKRPPKPDLPKLVSDWEKSRPLRERLMKAIGH